jgi:DNA sulfur modification protein DndB
VIESFIKDSIREKLEIQFDKNWWKKGVPAKVYISAETIASQKNREIEDETKEVEPWDCLHIIDYREIINHNKSWLLKD